ncbi:MULTISPECIES: cellulose-binding domain-containing protein [unclassified Kitasatospora]|uniref:cellulose-binding domain-containing protein n=1 Tax=unclassified Kitasatospora TaxID=2633591 RepID=UPI00071119FC|nr:MULTISPECIES: cellulose-binding domain-containing protein [unclassified Kitasatospora]KQV04557.1 xyloglucanase [Kitasatospora sp. Root107]KRB60917.1 xyloglucanase [Kitasatospora sp. Root187]
MTRLLSRPRAAVTALAVSCGLAVSWLGGPHQSANAADTTATAAGYSWGNVRIDGGGFVPGIVFNQSEAGLVYARTDIGGAYRQDPASKKWIPLLDSLGWNDWNLTGVASLATDPVQTNRVYVAAGTYTNSWDPNNGAILRSTDKGATWARTTLPFKIGGNMPGRGMGERLAIDPNNDKVVYLGAPEGNGLWRSTDYGVSWAKVASFPNAGNYAPDPTDTNGYLSAKPGVLWVTFDKSSASAGATTQTLYAGVADKDNSVYKSVDGGATWNRLAGQPTGYLPHKGVLDPVNGYLYLATSDTGGPYDGAKGDVWRYATRTGEWTQLSPVRSTDSGAYFGYSGLTVDRLHPNVLMVTGYSSWYPDTQIYRSTDFGATWKPIWEYNGYPTRVNHYTMDISSSPWLSWGNNPSPPEQTPKLGWMTEALEIDPFDSDRMMYGTGATVYGTDNLTAWDAGTNVAIRPMVQGLEETAVNDLVSPPSGAPLLSALGDIGGFRHTSLTTVPPLMYQSPNHGSTTALDFAQADPNRVVRVGNTDTDRHIAFSNDNGVNWYQPGAEPAGITGGGTVALAADGSRVVWSPAGAAPVTAAFGGSSFTAVSGLPAGASVQADRVNPLKFYGTSAGGFYLSTDGGLTFAKTAATGLPVEGNVRFKALPGVQGDVWLAGGKADSTYGLWHSTDSGASFTRSAAVTQADSIGFGKAAPGASYPALYSSAQIGGVRGIFRSDDAGASWVRINDDAHQWAWTGAAITGDPRVYGRVYLSTNGRGIIVGDTTVTPTVTPTATPSASPSSNSPTPSPSSTPSTGCEITYSVSNQWSGGFGAAVTVKNTGPTALTAWTVKWSFTNGQQVTSLWNGAYTQTGAAVSVANLSYNGTLAANGGSTSFGFNGSWTGSNGKPTAFTLNGSACTVK